MAEDDTKTYLERAHALTIRTIRAYENKDYASVLVGIKASRIALRRAYNLAKKEVRNLPSEEKKKIKQNIKETE